MEPQRSSASMMVAPRSKYGASPRPVKPKVSAVPMTPPKASFPPREKWMDERPPPPPGPPPGKRDVKPPAPLGPPPGKRAIGLVDGKSIAAVNRWIGRQPRVDSSSAFEERDLKRLPYDCSLLEEAECLYCKEDASRVCAACSAAVCDRKRCSRQIRNDTTVCTTCLAHDDLLKAYLMAQGLLEGGHSDGTPR